MLGQVFIEMYVHGNMYKEDALKATDMVASILKSRILPKATQRDTAQIKLLNKLEVMEFLNRPLKPVSSRRDRLSIHLQDQGKAEGVDKRQEEAQKNANM
ncbi:hypothetical protein FOTG_15121 [Fusarium oxysporum f. sp. vasinfectum 25433]|uniref:Uncharacterized protein n=1 Tax=Fusarium oxysporum f. sp. vasinfectum 25433 TaxID=1089449 RepID=X0L6L1_FUSOX|nr:hypothetical protein FOTG_15121 [Fusarium oxysporum f. sp. vasinfectum 25433]